MLQVDSISYTAGKKEILKDISLDIKSGELLAVLGANGAGKSTLLKVISGDVKPDSGNIFIEGKPLSKHKPDELALMRGVLTQSFSLNMPFKVEEVVMMGRYPHFKEFPSPKDYEIARVTMQQVDVLNLKDRVYTTLSGGEKQRVHIARVLSQLWNEDNTASKATKYLLLDEPVSSLDILHQHRILQLGSELKEKGYAVLAILHDINLASQYADKVAILKSGKVIACGNTKDALTEENIYQSFGMTVSVMNHPGYPFPFIVPDILLPDSLIEQTNKIVDQNLINH